MSSFPFGWIGFVVLMMCVSSVMRAVFGGWRRWDRYPSDLSRIPRHDRASRQDVERLDAALAERDGVIDDLQQRLSELESRLDFTERLLAERHEPARVAGSGASHP
jgi:hypothetical protein